MAKLTLIEIVSDIANDLDTEPVNSISDTIESVQIAQIVRTSFFELIANRNWPHLRRTIQLDSVSDVTRPTHVRLPELIKELEEFSYNRRKEATPTRDNYKKLRWMEPSDFLRRVNNRNIDNANVDRVTDYGGATFLILNDKQPEYFTSFDDEYLVLDSYNQNLEDTIQTSNTQAIVYLEPDWQHVDSHIPDLPSEAFPLLVEEAKSTAFVVLKQSMNSKAEDKSRRQRTWLSRKAWRAKGGVIYPNYGRSSLK